MNIKNHKILKKLNALLIMNYEVEQAYFEAYKCVNKEDLKSYFKALSRERNEFDKTLRLEIDKFNGELPSLGTASRVSPKIEINFRDSLFLGNEMNLINEVYEIKYLTVEAYDNLLIERGAPLSLCKLLVKQRDQIQDGLIAIKRESVFVA